jgi:hypothetical protein
MTVADPPAHATGPLFVVETEAAWYVSWSRSQADWIAEFRRGSEAGALAWAVGMADAYNRRIREATAQHPRRPAP